MASRKNNGEGSIRLRDDGKYEVRVSGGIDFATGKHIRISKYANTKAEADNLLRQMSLSVGNSNVLLKQRITLGKWLDLSLEVYMKNSLKQSTRAGYETYIRKHFKPVLGNVILSDLSVRQLQMFYNYKLEEEHLTPKTIANMNIYLHRALEFAVGEGLIASNPASAVNLPKQKRPQIEILTRDEQAALVRASYLHRYGVFVRLVLVTGLRLGELLGLQWQDIDLRTKMLHVRRTLNRLPITGLSEDYRGPRTQIVLQEPKTENSLRTIPLIPEALQDLFRWKAVQEADRECSTDYTESGMIVTNPNGGYIEPRTFSDYYSQILKMAGLHHFTFHALRHTFASRAMEQGMDNKTLSVLLGHYSMAFTMDTYAHVLEDHKWEGINLMQELYHIDQQVPITQVYPVVLTPMLCGGYHVTAPDFPSVEFEAHTIEQVIETAKEKIHDILMQSVYPPAVTLAQDIILQNGQFILQISM